VNTTDEFVIAQLTEANPVPDGLAPSAQERAQAERILRRVLEDAPAPRPRRARSGILAVAASVLVVLIVTAVALRTGGSSGTGSTATSRMQITLRAAPTPQTPRVTAAAMSRATALLRLRLASIGHGFTVRQAGADTIVVTAPEGATPGRPRITALVTAPARLGFYDWEANVLTANGKIVASQLSSQNGAALAVSQGAGSGPGSPGPGSSSLYDAVRLAARQPRVPVSRFLLRVGPEYYLFGASGSAACAAAAAAEGTAPAPAGHCLLAGPLEPGSAIGRTQAVADLAGQLPAGVHASDGQVLTVPQGTLVVQAEQPNLAGPVSILSPAARFFVMRDHVALTGSGITRPRAGTDQAGEPDVTFGFTGTGRRAFERATAAIARRGAGVSAAGESLNQHFAVVLDGRLLTVPSISFQQYPDGIVASNGADITGGFTEQAARDLATQLRYGPLPLALRVVS
jgi:SecD/SecF fusion protein